MYPHIEPHKGLFFLQCVMEGSVGTLARGRGTFFGFVAPLNGPHGLLADLG